MGRAPNVELPARQREGGRIHPELRRQRRALGEFVRSLAEVTGGLFSTRDDPSELEEALTTLATRMGTHYDEMSTFYRVTVRCPESRGEDLFVGVSRLDVSLRLFPGRRLSSWRFVSSVPGPTPSDFELPR